jgi:hypothetical protein
MGDGDLRKISKAVFISMILIGTVCFLIPSAKSNITLWPGILTINMSEYPEGEIEYKKIYVTNPYDYEVEVITEIANPQGLTKGYSNIPDLSWIDVNPEVLSIPAKSDGCFSLIIDIPEEEKASHYNESWEVWIRFFKKPESDSGVIFNVKLASKIFIHTPEELKQKIPYNPIILITVFAVLLLVIVAYFYFKRKPSISSERRAVFYVKKRNK